MLRLLVRFFALMLMATGFAALVVDGARSIASNALVLTSLRDTLTQLAPTRLPALQAALEKKIGHWAWDPIMTSLVALPTWLLVGALGALLFLLTRRRRPTIGYSSR